ncbi:MAG: hypothetical protein WBA68_11540 [Alteraurantiacibacter sp.]
MTIRSILTLAAAPVLLAACNSSEDSGTQAETPQPEPVLTQAPTATAAPDGSALVPGALSVTEDADGARAMFGEEDVDTTLSLVCSPDGQFTMGLESGAEAETWRLDAGGEAARVDMVSDGNEVLSYLVADLDPGLGIVDAMGETGQVFTLTSPEGERLQFPTNPGIRRVIAACR